MNFSEPQFSFPDAGDTAVGDLAEDGPRASTVPGNDPQGALESAPLGTLAFMRPVSVRVLAEVGIDLSLHHRLSMSAACRRHGIHPAWLWEEIDKAERPSPDQRASWSEVRPDGSSEEWLPSAYV